MLHAALLAAALHGSASTPTRPPASAIAQCFATMDGAVYHGDPSDRSAMKANVATCRRAIAQIDSIRPRNPAQGPEKLFITGRVLDRAATLSYMGLDDAATALREVKRANLYFRIASGLTNQPDNYHMAALANVALTRQQLATLYADPAVALTPHVARRVAKLP